jgi:PrcB C-terminal
MKKVIVLLSLIFLFSCATNSSKKTKPLFEILTEQNNGGASIQFYEILTEEKEIVMLLNDGNLKKKIKPEDIKTANFIILNLGEKTTGGYSINVESVEETANQIILTIKEIKPKSDDFVTDVMSNPYTIVKINSKKEIVIK